MAKQKLTIKKKNAGTFIRLKPEFKKKVQVFAIENGYSLTSLIESALIEFMESKNT